LIDAVWEELRRLVESSESRLVTRIAPDLPRVSVAPRRTAHVFSNFVTNAVKYAKPGGEIVSQAKNHQRHQPRVGRFADRPSLRIFGRRRSVSPGVFMRPPSARGMVVLG